MPYGARLLELLHVPSPEVFQNQKIKGALSILRVKDRARRENMRRVRAGNRGTRNVRAIRNKREAKMAARRAGRATRANDTSRSHGGSETLDDETAGTWSVTPTMNSYFFCCLHFDILYIFEGFLYIFLMNDSEIYRYLTYGFWPFFFSLLTSICHGINNRDGL